MLNFLSQLWRKSIFLLIMQKLLFLIFYISSKHGPNLSLGRRNNFYFSRNAVSLLSVKPKNIALRSTDINFDLSDILHENKQNVSVKNLSLLSKCGGQTVRDNIQQNLYVCKFCSF
jgi:hypothetical protein